MRILLAHRHFFPDSPSSATTLLRIALRLADEGHEVSIFSTQPSYHAGAAIPRQPWREKLQDVSVRRVWLFSEIRRRELFRIVNLILFSLRLFFHIVRHRYDVVVVSTIPPVLAPLAAYCASHLVGSACVYNCQDLYPEVAIAAGVLRPSLATRLMAALDKQTVKRVQCVVVLSDDMRETVRARGIDIAHVRVINNFHCAEEPTHRRLPLFEREAGRQRVVFAGNLGEFQGLDVVLDCAHALSESRPELEFHLIGAGSAAARLRSRARHLLDRTVFFHGYQTPEVTSATLEEASAALITLSPGVIRAAFPSKFVTALAAGVPILAVVEQDSDLSALVRRYRLGFSVDPREASTIENALLKAVAMPLLEVRERAHALLDDSFSESAITTKWIELLRALN